MSIHAPHEFQRSENPRIRCCVKCGRIPEWYWHIEPKPARPQAPQQIREILKWILGRQSYYTMSEDVERDAELLLDA